MHKIYDKVSKVFTQKEKDDDVWVNDRKYKIVESVGMIKSADLLRKINDLINNS